MLRPTPGALSSQRLEERPANLPTQLYVCGGRPVSRFSAVVLEPDGPRLVGLDNPEDLQGLREQGFPIWLRVCGLSESQRIGRFLAMVDVPESLLPPLLEVP